MAFSLLYSLNVRPRGVVRFPRSLVILPFLLMTSQAFGEEPPRESLRYKRMVIGAARAEFGLEAPVSLFASQISVESDWRPAVESKYAAGLTQFTEQTADWAATRWRDLRPANPLSPAWAIRAAARYNRFLFDRMDADTDCDRYAMMFASFNGGQGNHRKDVRLTRERGDDPRRWWGHVEKHSNRADWAFRENREYPRRIMRRQSIYASWGGDAVCEGRSDVHHAR